MGSVTPSSVPGSASTADQVHELLNRMQEFADAGDWQKVQALIGRMQSLIELIPQSRRRDALLEASRGIERIHQSASYARNEVGEKLTAIRQGRKAAASYKAAGALR